MLNVFKDNLFSLIERDQSQAREELPKILVAVSGGVDSMALASLFYSCYYPRFAIATVNFKLRHEESDADEELVKLWSRQREIPFYSCSFDTLDFAKREKISVEMAARDLRYSWFYELLAKEDYEYIAIAHNLNDSVETLFLNLLRGTGIDGLGGIKEKNGKIIRPLIKFTRKEITEYCVNEEVPFRIDKSNLESNYSRNRIRNMVFPEFEIINPSFLRTVGRDIEYFNAAGDIIKELFIQKKEKLIEAGEGKIRARININALKSETHSKYWLFVLLSEYGFNSSQTDQIYDSIEGQPGKEFHTTDYLLIKDRDFFLLYSKGNLNCSFEDPFLNRISLAIPDQFGYSINFRGKELSLKIYPRENSFIPNPSKTTFFLDADKLKFPLLCRLWQEGDRFIPLGMNGFKKLSDFYIDAKLDIKSKDCQIILTSKEEIVCLLGHRIDDRYKITDSTISVFEVTISQ